VARFPRRSSGWTRRASERRPSGSSCCPAAPANRRHGWVATPTCLSFKRATALVGFVESGAPPAGSRGVAGNGIADGILRLRPGREVTTAEPMLGSNCKMSGAFFNCADRDYAPRSKLRGLFANIWIAARWHFAIVQRRRRGPRQEPRCCPRPPLAAASTRQGQREAKP
jgi:hypothetical protein